MLCFTAPIYSFALLAPVSQAVLSTLKGQGQVFSYVLSGSLWERPIIPCVAATSFILSYPLNMASLRF